MLMKLIFKNERNFGFSLIYMLISECSMNEEQTHPQVFFQKIDKTTSKYSLL